MTALFDRAFPGAKPMTRRVWQAQVVRFLREIQPGDAVATYDPNARVYLLGKIVGEPEWREDPMPSVRRVDWTQLHQRASRFAVDDVTEHLANNATVCLWLARHPHMIAMHVIARAARA